LKSLLLLWQTLANETASRCCTSATMDVKTVRGRVENEGVSFLTITLPQFGKDFERALDLGAVDRSLFAGFQRTGGLPRFLRGYLGLIFDRCSGLLLSEPDIDAILAVRQLTLLFGKMRTPCSPARETAAIDGYVQCEQDVREADKTRSPIDLETFRRVSALLFRDALTVVDRDVYYGGLVPKHGPGATADGLYGNQKYNLSQWTARLEKYFPSGEFLLPNWSYYDQLDQVDILEPGAEMPVKVITVPKTHKTPRVIAKEPTAMMFCQQALREKLTIALKGTPDIPSPGDDYLSYMIGIDDQVPNQDMARRGSQGSGLATLDLGEASDRVSNQLVRVMLANHPHLLGAVDACRSRKAEVRGHGVVRLAKYASMGSALTFPLEAMVFLTLVFIGIEQELSTPLRRRTVHRLIDKVRVYGDDIIVPVEYVRSVVSVLEHFGAKVNTAKSFWTGRFRESCGKEFYDGVDVSIVRFRYEFPTRRTDATEVVGLIAFRNHMYHHGYWATCRWLDDRIRDLITYFPVVESSSSVRGRHSFLPYQAERQCKQLWRPLVRGFVVHAPIPENSLGETGALSKFFLKRGSLPSADEKHLERSGRPKSVNIKLGWHTPY
jgi:hypothetical protein